MLARGAEVAGHSGGVDGLEEELALEDLGLRDRGQGAPAVPGRPRLAHRRQDLPARTGALTYGGGLDYQLTRTWALRADVQRERWRFSQNSPYLYPVALSIGASYQFRFHGRSGPGL